jgi:hypothetical protein
MPECRHWHWKIAGDSETNCGHCNDSNWSEFRDSDSMNLNLNAVVPAGTKALAGTTADLGRNFGAVLAASSASFASRLSARRAWIGVTVLPSISTGGPSDALLGTRLEAAVFLSWGKHAQLSMHAVDDHAHATMRVLSSRGSLPAF